jgi:thioredoxin-dependent peroxiredoxin
MSKEWLVFGVTVTLLGLSALSAEEAVTPLAAGANLPKLSATNQNGAAVDLCGFKGQKGLVIFFFPKAFTPGCTAESCGFSDERAQYLEKGFEIFGVSRDTPEQLKKFKEEYKLSYQLLSDPEGQLAKALGVPPGARQTVIVGKDGKLERVIAIVAAKTHPQELLKEFQNAP